MSVESNEHAQDCLRRLEGKKAENTVKTRRKGISAFLEWAESKGHDNIPDLTAFEIENHLVALRNEGRSDHDIHSRFYSIRVFYNYLEQRGVIEENPLEDYSVRKELELSQTSKKARELRAKGGISYIDPDEKELMCEHAGDADGNPLRNELLVRLLWHTGLRRGELVVVKISDIDREASPRRIEIWAEKVKDQRTVYYQSNLDFLMGRWIDRLRDDVPNADDSDYLFPTRNREHIDDETVNDRVKQMAKAAGIQSTVYEDHAGGQRKRVTAHTLRHSFAVQSLKNGMDIRSLQKIMGHSKLETTQKYLEVLDDDVAEVARKFGAGTEGT